uniref:Putative capsid protein n=1 Tax=viral metagenome TaxID=1070528 RepID=A0A6M3IPM9_9ZZZZ
MKETIKELATGRTAFGNTRGTSSTTYLLEPRIWLKEILDAAKKRLFFTQFVYTTQLSKGQKDVVIPKRTTYKGSSGITYATASPADGTAITATVIDNLDGVPVTPAMQASRVTIGNYAIRTNALDLIRAAQDELIYSVGDKVDAYVAGILGDATAALSTATGMQTLFGGDATSDATLAAGDVITTDLVAEGRTRLMDSNKQYRATGGAGGGYGAVSGSIAGNPWTPTPDEPFVLFIGPAQEEAFLKDSQFVNAAEYGSNKVVMNGEIGEYIGVKIVVTNNVERVAASGTGVDAEATTVSVAMTRCMMVKARRCGALAWGLKPQLKFWDNAPQVSQDVILESAYAAAVVYADAIVCIDVADA